MKQYLIALCLLPALAAAGTCSLLPATGHLDQGVFAVPDTVVSGQPFTVSVKGNMNILLNKGGASIFYTVLKNGVNIYGGSFDPCNGASCPIQPGPFSMQKQFKETIPNIFWGEYTLQARLHFNADNTDQTCSTTVEIE